MHSLAATVVAAIAILAAPQATDGPAARIVLTKDGLVWLLGGDSIKRIDLEGHRVPASVPALEGKLADFAVSPDGEALFRLVESKGKSSTLVAHAASTGAELGRWEIRALGRSLAMAPDGTALAIVGLRPGAGKKPDASDWTLNVLDIVKGEITEPHPLGQIPRGVAILGSAAGAPILYLATDDRILTYALTPLKASRFYTSPGMNRAVAGTGRSAVLHVLRDSSLAVIDPSRWSRAGGRVQLSDDDATSVVSLGSPGVALTLSADGSAAFVLHEDHRTLSIIDTAAASVIDIRSLDGERDLMAGPTPDGRIVLASSDPGGALTTISTPPAAAIAERIPPAEQPPPVPPPPPESPPVASEPQSVIPEPAESAEPGEKEAQVQPESVPEPEAVTPAVPEPAPETEPSPPAPQEEPGDSRPGLSGSLSGDFKGAKEVLLYGPDSLLRLAARAPVAGDGTFRFDVPPPGSYRVIVSGGPDGQVFTNPRFRTIKVEAGGTGSKSLDFEVLGQI